MDVPRTLLVTNDYPPAVGGIQRTLEALVGQLPADRVAVFCPDRDEAAAFDEEVGYRVLRQPDGFLWPVPDVGDRIERAAREIGAEVVLFGATYPLGMLGPRLSAAGLLTSRLPTGSSTGCRSPRVPMPPCAMPRRRRRGWR